MHLRRSCCVVCSVGAATLEKLGDEIAAGQLFTQHSPRLVAAHQHKARVRLDGDQSRALAPSTVLAHLGGHHKAFT